MSEQHNNTIALIGNPNCGKTTLFNALTGSRQRVGNWPGVTVERKVGNLSIAEQQYDVIDLPGLYSSCVFDHDMAIDERIASDFIRQGQARLVINVVDASNLERNLYLTTQLLEMGQPMLVVLNMYDVAKRRQMKIDVAALQKRLACPVLAISSRQAKDLKHLKNTIQDLLTKTPQASSAFIKYPKDLVQAQQHLMQQINCPKLDAIRILEGDASSIKQWQVSAELLNQCNQMLADDSDIITADVRYQAIQQLVAEVLQRQTSRQVNFTKRLDNIVLNRFLGAPIFLLVMYAMFFFAINIGGAFQDLFDISTDTVFVQGFAHLLNGWGAPPWLVAILAAGAGRGLNTTITFIPVIGAMFLFLAFLEDCGYMARAAFVMDRVMHALGLPGKSFVPMIVGFGCNVPAVMGARTLENKRDRILTIMMMPFMSCSARLAIFAVFSSAFFPVGGQNIVFALYLIGIAMAILTGLLLRKSLLKGEPSPLVMELPPYHLPGFRSLSIHTWQRLKGFVIRAGRLIVPICILIGALSALNTDLTLHRDDSLHPKTSMLAEVGQAVTPVFASMGIKQDNWPATVGLMTGILAKEVVVATLNTLYTEVGHLRPESSAKFDLWGGLKDALASVPANLKGLKDSFSNPILASAPEQNVTQGVYGVMYQRFGGGAAAFAYLLFILLYFPCVSTTAAMRREINWAWTLFSVAWTSGMAYGVAVIFYQASQFSHQQAKSTLWIVAILAIISTVFLWMRHLGQSTKPSLQTREAT